jgi:methyl-accepting chemotaxis protein
LTLESDVREQLDRVKGPLEGYLLSAERAIDLTARRSDRAPAQLKQFNARFSRLESAMSNVSDQLEASLRSRSQETAASATLAQWGMAARALVMLALLFFAYRIISRSMIRPVEQAADTLMLLSAGNRTVEIDGIDRRDEIGDLARGIAAFRDTAAIAQTAAEAQEMVERLKEAERKAALALTERKQAEDERRQALRDMADAFERRVLAAVETVAETAAVVQRISADVAGAARDTRSEVTIAAGTGTQIVSNMQEVATAATQLNQSANGIGSMMADTLEQTITAARLGHRAAARTDSLVSLANEIGAITAMIGDIARQTNQLALNATIEATRAGDAGRGFAVVAAEVKSLAGETARATQGIEDQIKAMQAIVADVNASINEVSASVSNVEQVSTAVAASIEEQSLATSAIGRNVAEVANGTRGLSASVATVESIAMQGDEQARQLVESAHRLERLSADLRTGVVAIIDEVRAA